MALALLFACPVAQATMLTWDANTVAGGAQDGGGTWNTALTNWVDGGTNQNWSNSPPDSAIFGVGGPGSHTVTLGEDIDANDLTFNAGPTYTIAGGNTLTLHGTHAHGASTYSYITLAAGQQATINAEISSVYPLRVYGSGGTGEKLILTHANSFGGSPLRLVPDTGATLSLRHNDAAGNASYVFPLANSAVEVQDGVTIDRVLYLGYAAGGPDGKGDLRSVSGDNEWSGEVRIHSARPDGTIGVDAGSSLTVSGQIRHYGGGGYTDTLTKVGDGTLVVTHANTYTGPTYVKDGIVNIRNNTALGTAAAGTTVQDGATLQVQNNITVAAEALDLTGYGVGSNGALRSTSGANTWNADLTMASGTRIGVDTGSTLTINGQMTVGGWWRKVGGGKLILTAANTQSNRTDIGGIVNLRHDNALGGASGGYAHVASGSTLELEGHISVGNNLYIGNSTPSGTSVDFRSVSGDNEWAGYVRLHSGHPYARIDVNGGSTLTISGIIEPHGGSVGSLTKLGDGKLIVTHANTYTGPTYVEEGTLLVNNTSGSGTGSGAVTVNGGTLGGTGTISGAVTIADGSTISPGDSPGTISMGDTTWNGGGTYLWEINHFGGSVGNDPGWDLLNITGTLTISATQVDQFTIDLTTLKLNNDPGPAAGVLELDDSFEIARTSGGIIGFDPDKFVLDTSGFDFDIATNYFKITQEDKSLYLNYVPEPATMTLLALGALGLVARRRRR